MNPEQFQQALAERGINLSSAQMKQFAEYYDLLVATNEHDNLTRITERKSTLSTFLILLAEHLQSQS